MKKIITLLLLAALVASAAGQPFLPLQATAGGVLTTQGQPTSLTIGSGQTLNTATGSALNIEAGSTLTLAGTVTGSAGIIPASLVSGGSSGTVLSLTLSPTVPIYGSVTNPTTTPLLTLSLDSNLVSLASTATSGSPRVLFNPTLSLSSGSAIDGAGSMSISGTLFAFGITSGAGFNSSGGLATSSLAGHLFVGASSTFGADLTLTGPTTLSGLLLNSSTATGSLPLNPVAFGAKENGVLLVNGTVTASATTLSSTSASFTAGDVGKYLFVRGAGTNTGSTDLVTTISAVNSSTNVTMGTVSANTITGTASVVYGTDDTAAWRLLAAAVPTYGAQIWVPAGTTLLTGTVTFANPVAFIGAGEGNALVQQTGGYSAILAAETLLISTAKNTDGLDFAGAGNLLNSFAIYSPVTTPTSGNLIDLPNAQHTTMLSVTVIGGNTATSVSAPLYSSIIGCHFGDGVNGNLFFSNPINYDTGDNAIANNSFFSAATTSSFNFGWTSGGGVRFIGNKINGGAYTATYGILMTATSITTSDIQIIGNSIENVSKPLLINESGTGSLGNIQIVGNQSLSGNWEVDGTATNSITPFQFSDNIMGGGSLITSYATAEVGSNHGGSTFPYTANAGATLVGASVTNNGSQYTIFDGYQALIFGGTSSSTMDVISANISQTQINAFLMTATSFAWMGGPSYFGGAITDSSTLAVTGTTSAASISATAITNSGAISGFLVANASGLQSTTTSIPVASVSGATSGTVTSLTLSGGTTGFTFTTTGSTSAASTTLTAGAVTTLSGIFGTTLSDSGTLSVSGISTLSGGFNTPTTSTVSAGTITMSSLTNSGNTVSVSSVAGLYVGALLSGTNFSTAATVVSINTGNNSFVPSINPTGTTGAISFSAAGLTLSAPIDSNTNAIFYTTTNTPVQIYGPTQQLLIGDNGNPAKMLLVGWDAANTDGEIQSVILGVGFKQLMLNPNGGSVGVGYADSTTVPSLLSVGGSFTATGAATIGGALTVTGASTLVGTTTLSNVTLTGSSVSAINTLSIGLFQYPTLTTTNSVPEPLTVTLSNGTGTGSGMLMQFYGPTASGATASTAPTMGQLLTLSNSSAGTTQFGSLATGNSFSGTIYAGGVLTAAAGLTSTGAATITGSTVLLEGTTLTLSPFTNIYDTATTTTFNGTTLTGSAVANMSGAWTHSGAVTMASTLLIKGATTVTLATAATTTQAAALTVSGGIGVGAGAVIGGTVTLAGNTPLLTVAGPSTFSSAVTHSSTTSLGGHIVSFGSNPTTTTGAGAGSTGTCGIVAGGNDSLFSLTVSTAGTAPTANATIATVTFNSAFATAPTVVGLPANTASAALISTTCPFVSSVTTGGMVITSGSGALTNTTSYIFNFFLY